MGLLITLFLSMTTLLTGSIISTPAVSTGRTIGRISQKNSGITPTSYFVCCRSHRPHCVDHLQLLVPSWSHSCLLLPPRHDEIQKGQSRSGRRIGKNPGKNVRILGHFLPHCFPHILYYIQYCVLDKLFIKSHVVNHFSFLV